MLAVRWHARRDVRLDEVPEPEPPAPGELQLDIRWCGICGTDIEEWQHGPIFVPTEPHPLTRRCAPLTLGHEFTGVVISIGEGVTGVGVGDLVANNTLISCGECDPCRIGESTRCTKLAALGLMGDGGLTERVNVPATTCLRIPGGVSVEQATLAEPLAVGVRALRRGRCEAGDKVAVIGGGAVGLLAAQAARALGAASVLVVEPAPSRRAIAEALGIGVADRDDVPRGAATLVIECSGSAEGLSDAVALTIPGGRIVLVGLYPAAGVNIDATSVVSAERELLGSLSHTYHPDFVAAMELLGAGSISTAPLITDRVPLRETLTAFDLLMTEPSEHLKILIGPMTPR